MNFKKGDRVECVKGYYDQFTKGKTYIVRKDGLSKRGYLLVEEDDLGKENGHYPKYFKLIEENKMRTDKKVMIEVLRKAADNIEKGLDAGIGIEYKSGYVWTEKEGFSFHSNSLYRLKPETITLKNGVEIPKPLDIKDLDSKIDYYTPFLCSDLYYAFLGFFFRSKGIKIAYKTKEEAIEASKALFGIE